MRIVERFPRAVREIRNQWITLADGVRLAARIWLPEDAEPVPAILEAIPYRKHDGTAVRDVPMAAYLAGHGYAYVRLDLRGSGDSEGLLLDEYLAQEHDDCVEVIAWLAAQPWCTGKVGMTGISWGGFNALQVAARRPPALAAIITLCSTDERYDGDVHYIGGALSYQNFVWGSAMLAIGSQPPSPDVVVERWRAMWLQRLRNATLLVARWLENQRRDDYWKHGSVCEDYGAITCAVYAVGGWADGYASAIPRLMAGLACPRKALIGPWARRFPHLGVPGPAIGYLQECLRWWDHWLKGIDSGLMAEPMIRVWMQESVPPRTFYAARPGRWVAEQTWPSPRIRPLRYALNADGLGETPVSGPPLVCRSPQSLGVTAGEWCPYGFDGEFPSDQRPDDGQSLVFDSAPLPERLEVLGAPVVTLSVAADRPVAHVVARLCDVAPDGSSTRVSYKPLNLTRRDDFAEPAPLEPGRFVTARFALYDLAHAFPAGHRIRLALSTTMWPMIWPAPEDPTLTIATGASTLELPVRPSRAEDAALADFAEATSGPGAPITTIAPPERRRRVLKDVATGRVTMTFERDWGIVRHDDLGLTVSGAGHETYTITDGDPLSARQESQWVVRRSADAFDVTTRMRTVVTATAESFRVVATLDAYDGEARVAARSWDRAIPRDLL